MPHQRYLYNAQTPDGVLIRRVLEFKGVSFTLGDSTPCGVHVQQPVYIDRELVLPDTRVTIEYLEEKYPYPPLLPPDPDKRAWVRLLQKRVAEMIRENRRIDLDQVRRMLKNNRFIAGDSPCIIDLYLTTNGPNDIRVLLERRLDEIAP